jgi:plastocyanin
MRTVLIFTVAPGAVSQVPMIQKLPPLPAPSASQALLTLMACAALAAVAAPARADAPDDPIEVHIRDNRFVPDVIEVPADTKVRLLVINDGAEAEEFESYELNREKVIRPGSKVTIFLPPLKAGEYPFFGEFHPETARGKVVAK